MTGDLKRDIPDPVSGSQGGFLTQLVFFQTVVCTQVDVITPRYWREFVNYVDNVFDLAPNLLYITSL